MVQALVGSGGEAPQRWGELEEADMGPAGLWTHVAVTGSERRIDLKRHRPGRAWGGGGPRFPRGSWPGRPGG